MFFTDSPCFVLSQFCKSWACFFFAKTILQSWKIEALPEKSLFPVELNYLIRDTDPSNQLMMSFVWREFSSVRRKMMKEDSGVSNTQACGCPMAPQEIFKETQASKLRDDPVHPLIHQQSSVRPRCTIFLSLHVLCAMLGASRSLLF